MTMNLRLHVPSWAFPLAPFVAFFGACYIIVKFLIKEIFT